MPQTMGRTTALTDTAAVRIIMDMIRATTAATLLEATAIIAITADTISRTISAEEERMLPRQAMLAARRMLAAGAVAAGAAVKGRWILRTFAVNPLHREMRNLSGIFQMQFLFDMSAVRFNGLRTKLQLVRDLAHLVAITD